MVRTTGRTGGWLTIAMALLLPVLSCSKGNSEQEEGKDTVAVNAKLEGTVNAPDFPAGLDWLNTDHPISIRELRGKLVLLDFWTLGCINCIHVIPDLRRLEQKYGDDLVVIGVHSAKFTTEKGTDAIRQAILRYDIHHPVVNDSGFQIWSEYGANAWPTFVFINPKGKIIGTHSGEGVYDLFDAVIGQAIKYFDARGELKHGPLNLALDPERELNTLLSFPGKVSTDSASGRLFITDSNNNRIIITDRNGAILDAVGGGGQGNKDGSFEEAEFDHPQGTYLDGDQLYIADTENHDIRRADLTKRTVTTILGTGVQARRYNEPGTGTNVALNSPWDVLVLHDTLYIAMAGSHQIWAADLSTMEAKPYAGSAREGRDDGPRLEAALAQPSGLTTDGKKIYFADSESSSIREVGLGADAEVKTLVGSGLFDFGDRDGGHEIARLQHPLGVAFHDGRVWVTDTYNSKIKIINPGRRTSETYAGTGEAGYKDGDIKDAQFFEPGGLAFLGDTLYIADVNNQAIRVIDLNTKKVSTLTFTNLDKLHRKAPTMADQFTGRIVTLEPTTIAAGSDIVNLHFKLPHGYHYSDGAPFYVSAKAADSSIAKPTDNGDLLTGAPVKPVPVAVTTMPGKTELVFDAAIYFCSSGSDVCMVDNVRVKLPVTVAEGGAKETSVPIEIEARRPM